MQNALFISDTAPLPPAFSRAAPVPVNHHDGSSPAPLPWHWFDFDRSAAHGLPQTFPTIEEGGWQHSWQVSEDGRGVPFKFFRQAAPAGAPKRPTLLLAHGMGLTIATFHGIAPYLLQTHDLVLPDYSSFTPAGDPGTHPLSMKTFMRSIWRIADALSIERLNLGGNSLGGGLCLLAAIVQPQRVHRILLSNPACFPQTLPEMYRLARIPLIGELLMALTPPERLIGGLEYIGYVDKTRFDPELRRRYEESFSKLHNRLRLMQIIRQLPADARDSSGAFHIERLGEIQAPVLITWGGRDRLLTEGAGERLAAALPHATFERQGDLAHMPHEEAPERVGPRWAQFLNAP